jgi:cobalt-zinc-cadmium efflux system outer membrane protein
MPSNRRPCLLAVGLGLGLTACAAPPRVEHPSTVDSARDNTPIDHRAIALAWLGPDPAVRRAQAAGTDLSPLQIPPTSNPVSEPAALSGLPGQSIALGEALYGALTANPDLVALRQNAPASLEAVEVARRFPVTLNPTVFLNPRPGVWERNIGRPGYHGVQGYFNVSLRQPIELGHQTTHRYEIAKAAYEQARWGIAQAEVLALVQTYRFFQTAAYRREKLRLAEELVRFNERLVTSLRKGLEGGAGIQAADVALAEVEREAVLQQVEAARQDYATALADLQNQIGRPETAGTAEPLGEFILPPYIPEAEDEALIRSALAGRPEVHAALAAVQGARAAINLAKGDRIPTMVLGPEYTRDEFGNHFAGFVLIAPLPILNDGSPLVRQREAEFRRAMTAFEQVQQRTIAQVKSATAKWNAANRLVERTKGTSDTLKAGVDRLERLFEENATDITRLLTARQRLIQLENARLDAVWQATQAQADLLTALGASNLLAALQDQMVEPRSNEASPAPPAPSLPSPPPVR